MLDDINLQKNEFAMSAIKSESLKRKARRCKRLLELKVSPRDDKPNVRKNYPETRKALFYAFYRAINGSLPDNVKHALKDLEKIALKEHFFEYSTRQDPFIVSHPHYDENIMSDFSDLISDLSNSVLNESSYALTEKWVGIARKRTEKAHMKKDISAAIDKAKMYALHIKDKAKLQQAYDMIRLADEKVWIRYNRNIIGKREHNIDAWLRYIRTHISGAYSGKCLFTKKGFDKRCHTAEEHAGDLGVEFWYVHNLYSDTSKFVSVPSELLIELNGARNHLKDIERRIREARYFNINEIK